MNWEVVDDNDQAKIKVIGVGGAGGNAVIHMMNHKIQGVEFICANTDSQALENAKGATILKLGGGMTKGLGAGANPTKGRDAALESSHEIRDILRNDGTKMLFITAGMGGGTGTGAAPVIAQIAKELDILTVGIVTLPFDFEGKSKLSKAMDGIEELKKGCDSVITINLTVYPTFNETASATICDGETYDFGTQSLTEAGEFTEVFQSQNSCDSTVVLTLTVNPTFTESATASICNGDTYEFD